jgi:hypothetical protein
MMLGVIHCMLPYVDGSTCFILDYWMNTIDCGNGHTVAFILNDCLYYCIIYILYLYDWFYIYVHGFMEDTINWLTDYKRRWYTAI